MSTRAIDPTTLKFAKSLVRDKLLTRTGKPRKPAFTLTPKARKIVAAYAKTAKRCPACGATE